MIKLAAKWAIVLFWRLVPELALLKVIILSMTPFISSMHWFNQLAIYAPFLNHVHGFKFFCYSGTFFAFWSVMAVGLQKRSPQIYKATLGFVLVAGIFSILSISNIDMSKLTSTWELCAVTYSGAFFGIIAGGLLLQFIKGFKRALKNE